MFSIWMTNTSQVAIFTADDVRLSGHQVSSSAGILQNFQTAGTRLTHTLIDPDHTKVGEDV